MSPPKNVISVVHLNDGFAIILDYLLPFSLTKYSALVAEVKQYLGIVEVGW
jgi:hypothetical protein